MIVEEQVFVANVGDSRAILSMYNILQNILGTLVINVILYQKIISLVRKARRKGYLKAVVNFIKTINKLMVRLNQLDL